MFWLGHSVIPLLGHAQQNLRLGSSGFFLATQLPIFTLLSECSNGGKMALGGCDGADDGPNARSMRDAPLAAAG
jgi:hypothetical protein